MARDYAEQEKARTLTADDIALAVSEALAAQRKLERGSDWDQKHSEHHEAIDSLLPHIDDLISYIDVVKEREERRKRIYERVAGGVVISGLLATFSYVGKLVIESSGG